MHGAQSSRLQTLCGVWQFFTLPLLVLHETRRLQRHLLEIVASEKHQMNRDSHENTEGQNGPHELHEFGLRPRASRESMRRRLLTEIVQNERYVPVRAPLGPVHLVVENSDHRSQTRLADVDVVVGGPRGRDEGRVVVSTRSADYAHKGAPRLQRPHSLFSSSFSRLLASARR